MSKDKIVGKYNDKYIYYHDDSKEYYKLKTEVDHLDETEILALKVAESLKKKHDRVVRKKILKASLLTLVTLMITGGVTHKIVTENGEEFKYYFENSHDLTNDDEMLKYFVNSLKNNPTCSEEIRNELYKYLEVISKYDLELKLQFRVGKCLSKYDFSNFSGTNFEYYTIIDEILSLDDEHLIAQHLYAYVNDLDFDYNRYISMLIQDDKEVIQDLFNGKSLEKVLKERYDLEIDFKTMNSEEVNNLVKSKILELHSNIRHGISDYKVVLLASDIFGGNFIVRNNLFSDYICVSYNDEYNLYFQDGKNVTDSIYYAKLTEHLERDLTSLDPKNQEDRFLIYLYASMYYDLNSPEGLVNYLYPTEGTFNIEKEFVYKYYTNGVIDYSYLFGQINDIFIFLSSDFNTPEETEYLFNVLELVFLTLKEDLNDGLITKAEYDNIIMMCDDYLNEYYYNKREDLMERWHIIRDNLTSDLKLNLENKSIY